MITPQHMHAIIIQTRCCEIVYMQKHVVQIRTQTIITQPPEHAHVTPYFLWCGSCIIQEINVIPHTYIIHTIFVTDLYSHAYMYACNTYIHSVFKMNM